MRAPAVAGPTGRRARRVWLPQGLYEAMPWIYCALGAGALLSGVFLPDPAWLAPYLLLLGVSALHLGVWFLVLRRRYRLARRRRERQARPGGASFPGRRRGVTLDG